MKKLCIFIMAFLILFVASAFSPKQWYLTQDNVCPDSPATLRAGDIAVVIVPQNDTLNLRVHPGLDQKIITKIPPYTYVTIIAGPICDGGYRWFEIGWKGKDGWSAEVGPDGVYNMIPNGSPVPAQQQPNGNNPGTWSPPHDCEYCTPDLCLMYDVYRIGNDIYIPLIDMRRILNLDTLAAMGIPECAIKEWQSEWPPANWKIGSDIPDVNGDLSVFCLFKEQYFSSTVSLNPNAPCGAVIEPPSSDMGSERIMTGIIQIGPDIYVIINGERKLVPNPDTLDALGISRDMVDNWGASNDYLLTIPRGPDIPDVNRDPSGFQTFKEQYDSYVAPNYNGGGQPNQIVPVLEQYGGQEAQSGGESQSGWCKILPLFCASSVQGATNVACDKQCVPEARSHRPDMNEWIPRNSKGNTTSADILAAAQKEIPFAWNEQEQQVSVRDSLDVQAGDLVIWPQNCSGVTFSGGHIGYVESVDGILITITDSNWGKPISQTQCSRRDSVKIQIIPCMKFITSPYLIETNNATNQPIDKCSQYSRFSWLLCQIGLK